MRPIGGQAAAQAAQAAEQTRAVEAYQETYNILALDAQRTYEAQQRAALEDLRRETKRSGDRVKQLKDTALLLSAENLSKAELVDAMGARLAELSAELSTLSVMQARDSAASGLKTRTEDDKAAMLQTVFESTLEHAVSKRIAEGSAIAPTYQHQQVGPRRTAVYFCPEGEDRRNAVSAVAHARGGAALEHARTPRGCASACAACAWLRGLRVAARPARGCAACTWLRGLHVAARPARGCAAMVRALRRALWRAPWRELWRLGARVRGGACEVARPRRRV